jgi:nitrogenase-stabilizing/protective protein
MSNTTLPAALRDLETAEDFFQFFDLPYDPQLMARTRLHILQRLHDYMAETDFPDGDEAQQLAIAKSLLARAYDDFVHSHPLKERVFKVLKDAKKSPDMGGRAFVPLSSIGGLKRREE